MLRAASKWCGQHACCRCFTGFCVWQSWQRKGIACSWHCRCSTKLPYLQPAGNPVSARPQSRATSRRCGCPPRGRATASRLRFATWAVATCGASCRYSCARPPTEHSQPSEAGTDSEVDKAIARTTSLNSCFPKRARMCSHTRLRNGTKGAPLHRVAGRFCCCPC